MDHVGDFNDMVMGYQYHTVTKKSKTKVWTTAQNAISATDHGIKTYSFSQVES